jgi:phage replication O-like protein O
MTEGYTRVPIAYVDEHLADLSGAETKVLLAVLRKTAGWQKESDEISIEQLQQMTGLARNSVRAGLRGLLKRGLVVQRGYAAGSKAASYACAIPSSNGSKIDPLEGQKLTPKSTLEDDGGVKNCPSNGSKIDPLEGQKLTPQKIKDKRKDSARDARALSPAQNASGNTRDYLDHVLERLDGHDPVERTIRTWSLPPHLEAQCLAFARIFEVAPTKGDKARWAKGAETLHELHCDEARLKAARDEARKAGLICTWPGALVNLQAIRSIRQEYELVYDEERNGYVRQPKRN